MKCAQKLSAGARPVAWHMRKEIKVQVVGRPFEEELVLAVAAAIERETGGYRAPPL